MDGSVWSSRLLQPRAGFPNRWIRHMVKALVKENSHTPEKLAFKTLFRILEPEISW